jgi:hypothetical protein
MIDFGMLVVSGTNYEQFSRSFGIICRKLPREDAKRLCAIKDSYSAIYGFEGAHERMNNRSVLQIFAEYQPTDVKPIESGEVDGMRYRLYEAPSPPTTNGEGTTDE